MNNPAINFCKTTWSTKYKRGYKQVKKGISLVLCLLLFTSNFAYAGQIVIDNKTATTITIVGDVTDVTTSTILGNSALNSFKEFHVQEGKTVNLYVPSEAENLLNLVHSSSRSRIDGLLNSIQDGEIGGNVFFLNPHGMLVGTQGSINVGTLTVLTPTSEFMNSFFDSPYNPNKQAISQTLTGDIPIDRYGLITISGKINAIDDIVLASGEVENSGLIASGAVFMPTIDFSDVVNTNNLASGSAILTSEGKIQIGADNVSNTGTIFSSGGSVEIRGASSVQLTNNAVVDARGLDAAGDVTIAVAHTDHGSVGESVSDATILVQDSSIFGNDITLQAESDAKYQWAGLNMLRLGDASAKLGAEMVGIDVAIAEATAAAAVVIGSGANLEASGDVALGAHAQAVTNTAVRQSGTEQDLSVSFIYGEVGSHATVDVVDGATISGQNLSISSQNTSKLDINIQSISKEGESLESAIAVTHADVSSLAKIGSGATINIANNISVSALNENSFLTSATANARQDGMAGIAAVLFSADTKADALVDANLGGLKNITIEALDNVVQNRTQASSVTGGKELYLKVLGGVASATSFIENRLEGNSLILDDKSGQTEGPKLAGAISLVNVNQSALARVGVGAAIEVDESLVVAAQTRSADVQNKAQSGVVSKKDEHEATLALSAAIAFANYERTAEAYIGEDAQITASTIGVASDVLMPYGLPDIEWGKVTELTGIVQNLTQLKEIYDSPLLTGFANAAGEAEELGITGSVNHISFKHNSQAYLGQGVQITLMPTTNDKWSTTLAGGRRDWDAPLSIRAHTDVFGVFGAGNIGFTLQGTGGSEGAATIGGAYNQVNYDNTTKAFIADGVQISQPGSLVGDISVDAVTTEKLIILSPTAGRGGSFGFNGMFSLANVNSHSEASVSHGAEIIARNLLVQATNDIVAWSLTGAFNKSDSAGVGLSIAINDITTNTRAFIGQDPEEPLLGSTGSINVESLIVEAVTDGRIEAISVAGAMASANDTQSEPAGGLFAGAKAAQSSAFEKLSGITDTAKDENPAGTNFGLAISGSSAVNLGSLETRAYINQAKLLLTDDSSLTVGSSNAAHITAASGGAALTRANNESSEWSAGIAGSLALNSLETLTSAVVKDSEISGADDFHVYALASGQQLAVALGTAINASADQDKAASIAGSVSINTVTNQVIADVTNSTVVANSLVGTGNIIAYDSTRIGTGGGSLIAGGKGGFGAAITYSEIANLTSASVRKSTVSNYENLSINGITASRIASGGAMAGFSKGSNSGSFGGVVIINKINNSTSAEVSDSNVIKVNNLDVLARDAKSAAEGLDYDYKMNELFDDGSDEVGSSIIAVAGVIQASGNNVGVAFAWNQINNEFKAIIKDSLIEAQEAVKVGAYSDARIGSVGAGASLATGKFAGAATVTLNEIGQGNDKNSIIASISGDKTIIEATSLVVEAIDRSQIQSLAGQVTGGSKASFGGAISHNRIDNTVQASLLDGSFILADSVNVDASTVGIIRTLAAAAGGSGSFAFNGAVTSAWIQTNTLAKIDNTAINAVDLTVSAMDEAYIGSLAGGASGAGTAAVGGAVAINRISNTASALIGDSQLNNQGKTIVHALNNSSIETIAVSGALAGTAGFSGSAATSEISNKTMARMTNSIVEDTLLGDSLLSVQAKNTGAIRSISGAAAATGSAAVGAATSINRIANTTQAGMSGGQTRNVGSLFVQGMSNSVIESLAVGLGAGASVGVAGSVAVNLLNNNTEGYINDGANILARHNVEVLGDNQDMISNAAGAIGVGLGIAGVGASVSINEIGGSTRAYISDAATQVKVLTLAVKASSTHTIESITANVGGGLYAGVAGTTTVNKISGNTEAFVDASSIEALDASIMAENHAYGYSYVGAVAGGFAGVGIGSDTSVFSGKTTAYIKDSLHLQVDSLKIEAESTQEVSSLAVSGAGGVVGVVGSGSVAVFNSTTEAYLDSSVIHVGSLAVTAEHTSRLDTASGGMVVGGVALGATFSVALDESTTKAYITDSTVLADDEMDVLATSNTEITSRAASGAAGGAAGVAGSASVVLTENTTLAYVENSTLGQAANRSHSLSVKALDSVMVTTEVGAVGMGASAGVGASAAVTRINNTTSGFIKDSFVFTEQDASVEALAIRNLSSTGVSGGVGGSFGLGGAAVVTIVGESLSSDAASELDKDEAGTLSSIERFTTGNRLTASGDNANMDISDDSTTGVTQAELTNLNTLGNVEVRSLLNQDALRSRTTSLISDSTIDANGDIRVSADEKISASIDSGAVGAGLAVGIGGAVGIMEIQTNVEASVSKNTQLLSNKGRIVIEAGVGGFDPDDGISVNTYQGSGGFVSLGAAIANVDVTNNVIAQVEAGTIMVAQGDSSIMAADELNVEANAYGASVGVVTAGLVSATAQKSGYTCVLIGNSNLGEISTDINVEAGSFALSATRTGTIGAASWAGSAGVVSGLGAVARAIEDGEILVRIGDYVNVDVLKGLLQVGAYARPQVKADALGYVGTIFGAIGASFAHAESLTDTKVLIGSGGKIAAENLQVEAIVGLRGGAPTARSFAESASIGSLLGASATNSRAKADSTVAVEVNSPLNISENAQILASNYTSQSASTSGASGGFVGAGAHNANADAVSATTAMLRGEASTTIGGLLSINATGKDDVYADAVAGSGGVVSGAAAVADTSTLSNTNAKIEGSVVAHSMSIGASHHTNFDGQVSSVNAAVLGASGALTRHEINSVVKAIIDDAAEITTQDLMVVAENTVEKKPLSSGYNANAGAGGLLQGAAAQSISTIDSTANVVIGNNSQINVIGDRYDPGRTDFRAANNIFASDKARLDTGGAISVARAESKILSTNTATITMGTGSTILSVGVVNLGTTTRAELQTSANAKTYGLAAAAQGHSESTINSINRIELGENAAIRADGDIFLYAGRDGDGAVNRIRANAYTDLFNKTAVPISTNPRADGAINQTNQILTAEGSSVRSVGSISLITTEGSSIAHGQGSGKDLYRQLLEDVGEAFSNLVGGGDISLDIKGGSSTNRASTGVVVDGLLHAGIQNKQRLIIDRRLEPDFDEDGKPVERETFAIAEITEGISNPKITQEDLVTNAFNRIAYLKRLQIQYTNDAAATSAYQAEINYLEQELLRQGYADIVVKPDGSTSIFPILSLQAEFINIDDIWAKTGDVNITGDYLAGVGEIIAPNDTEITIINDSASFLRISDLLIEAEGGRVFFNQASVASAADINSRNRSGSPVALLDIQAAGTSNEVPIITVINNFNPDFHLDPNGGRLPAPDLQLIGDIVNRLGFVELTNVKGSILLTGQDGKAAPTITAETINLNAGKDIFQSFVDGFHHIGGAPESIWNDIQDGSEQGKKDRSSNAYRPGQGSWIAGNNVFLSARYLNINGTIQSGIPDWDLSIGNIDAFVQWATEDWIRRGRPSMANPANLTMYKINTKGNILTYFNPETRQIIVDGVEVQGGYAELYGHILNTGGGNIRVLDGFGRINITNDSNYDIVLNGLDTGNAQGLLRITDTAKTLGGTPITTVYERIAGLVTVSQYAGQNLIDSTTTDNARTASYQPVVGSRYIWNRGQSIVETWVGRVSTRKIFWGAVAINTNSYDSYNRTGIGTPRVLPDGTYIRVNGHNSNYQYSFANYTTDALKLVSRDEWKTYGKFDFVKAAPTYHVKDTYTKGSQDIHTHSLKADHSIGIEFIGYNEGQISVSSKGGIVLSGSIRNIAGDVNLHSTAGSLTNQSDVAVITGRNINLAADKGIGDALAQFKIDTLEGGALQAVSNTGNIHIQGTRGDLKVDFVEAKQGNVNIEADRHIIQARPGNSSVITGNRIDLIANSGGIGTANQPLNVHVGTTELSGLNVVSAEDISIRQAHGDLHLIQVHSLGGDVTLEVVNGSMVDANPEEQNDVRVIAQLERLWDDMLLTEDTAQASSEATLAAYQRSKEFEYNQYWQMRSVTPIVDEIGNVLGYVADDYDPNHENPNYHLWHEMYGMENYSDTFVYLVSPDEQKELTAGSVWTDNQLRNSISSSILFKQTTSTETRIKDPNVIGNNITLRALNGGVGTDDGAIVIDGSDPNALRDQDTRLALAAAEADDVAVDNERNEITVLQRKSVNVAASGEINVEAKDNVYLGSQIPIYVNTVLSGDSIRIKGRDGVYQVTTSGDATIQGGRTIIEGGDGGIGTVDNPLEIRLNAGAALTARAQADIYIREVAGNLNVAEIYGVNQINLWAFDSILDQRGERPMAIYGNAVNLVANQGSIGSIDSPLAIGLPATAKLTAQANTGSIHLMSESSIFTVEQMVSGATSSITTLGELLLGEIRAPRLELTAARIVQEENGVLSVGQLWSQSDYGQQLTRDNYIHHYHGINRVSGDLRLRTLADLILSAAVSEQRNGDISIETLKTLELIGDVSGVAVELVADSMTQTKDSRVIATSLTTMSSRFQQLVGDNRFTRLTATSMDQGDLVFVNHEDLLVNQISQQHGDISISNEGNLEVANAIYTESGNISLTVAGDIQQTGYISATDTIELAATGNVNQTIAAQLLAHGLVIRSGGYQEIIGNNTVSQFSSLSHQEGDIRLVHNGDLQILDIRQQSGKVDITNQGTLEVYGLVEVLSGALQLTADSILQAVNSRVVSDVLSTVTLGAQHLIGSNQVSLVELVSTSEGDIELNNLVALDVAAIEQHHGAVTLTNNGDLTTTGTIHARNGALDVTVLGSAKIENNVIADSIKVVASESLTQVNGGRFTAEQLITYTNLGQTLTGDNRINSFNSENTVSGNIVLRNSGDSLLIEGVNQAAGDLTIDQLSGSLKLNGSVVVAGNINITADDSMSTDNSDIVQLRGTDINLVAKGGSIGGSDKRIALVSLGELNALAGQDIYLLGVEEDLKAGDIIGQGGDVDLLVIDGDLDVSRLHAYANVSVAVGGDVTLAEVETSQLKVILFAQTDELTIDRLDLENELVIQANKTLLSHVVHTGSSPLLMDITGVDERMASLVRITATSDVGIRFDRLQADKSYIDAQVMDLSFFNTLVGTRAEFNNTNHLVIADNVNRKLFASDLQLYPEDIPFYLIMMENRTMLTDSKVVNYDDDYIINDFDTENSFIRITDKLPPVVSYVADDNTGTVNDYSDLVSFDAAPLVIDGDEEDGEESEETSDDAGIEELSQSV